jgi:hypothetical protein
MSGENHPPPMLSGRDRVQVLLAWLGWGVLAAVMMVIVAREPSARSVTPVYRIASDAFWSGQGMYHEGLHGWLYLPHSALLYTPFCYGPPPVGEAVYRLLITLAYAWGLWRVARLASPRGLGDYFPVMTLLAMPLAAGAIRNGQMNIALAASMALAAADLAERRWVRAGVALALGFMTKPLGVVMMLLAGVLRPRVVGAMVLGLLVTLGLPFLKSDWSYVLEQYRLGLAKVREAGEPAWGTFADLGGLLGALGVVVPAGVMTLARAAAAAAVLGLSWLALRRLGDRAGWVVVLGLASAYLMLFNPRTEGVSYPILMPAVAAASCWAWFRDRRLLAGLAWGGVCLVMAGAHLVTKGGDVALRPAATLVAMALLIWEVRRGRVEAGPVPSR